MIKIISRIKKKLINVLIFRRKFFFRRSSRLPNQYYLEKHEAELNHLLDNIPSEVDSYDELNNRLGNSIKTMLRKNGIGLGDISRLIAGKLIYARTGLTPDNTQQLLVDGYSRSNGLFQKVFYDFLYTDYIVNSGNKDFFVRSEIFGEFSCEQIDQLVEAIQQNGYIVLPKIIKKEYVANLKEWSTKIKYRIVDFNEKSNTVVDKIDFEKPNCVTANAFEADLLQNPEIMALVKDPVLKAIISLYLGGVEPVLVHLCMWWSFKSNKQMASSEAAQVYHYDLDQLKWLKVFIYLTDVSLEQGPHTYIPSSHAIGKKNYRLLERGYARVTDEEMKRLQKMEPCSLTGEAGTVIIGDTKCFHKGTPIVNGARLVLQPTFGPSKFLKKLVN